MAGQANVYAQKLLAMRPPMYDAYHTVGMIEYVMGSVPSLCAGLSGLTR